MRVEAKADDKSDGLPIWRGLWQKHYALRMELDALMAVEAGYIKGTTGAAVLALRLEQISNAASRLSRAAKREAEEKAKEASR